MSDIPVSTVIRSIITLLSEAYEGPQDASNTWFIDNQPDSGVLGILHYINGQQASESVDGSGASGTTIASHVEHLRWSLALMNGALRGEPLRSWSESWTVITISESDWIDLRRTLKNELDALRQALIHQDKLPGDYLTAVMALLPHAAYHLGVLRQMIERIQQV